MTKPYDLICQAVESAVNYGWHRAHKYADQPTEEAIKETIASHVVSEVWDVVAGLSLQIAGDEIISRLQSGED